MDPKTDLTTGRKAFTPSQDAETIEEVIPENLKEQINALLWTGLPPTTTMGQAEKIAVRIWAMLATEWGEVGDGARRGVVRQEP